VPKFEVRTPHRGRFSSSIKQFSDLAGVARRTNRRRRDAWTQSIAKGFQRTKTYGDIDRVIKLRKAIDALDRAIENRWGQAKQASKGLTSAYRPVAVEEAINNPDDLDGLPSG
jgi:hypothetical protein